MGELPPHALSRATATRSAPPPNIHATLRPLSALHFGAPSHAMPVINIQNAKKKERDAEDFSATDGAVVLTVKVAVPEPFAAGVTELGLSAQVGARFMIGVTEQVRFTALLNPFAEETVTPDVALFPGATLGGLRGDADSAKSGAVEVKVAVIVWSEPETKEQVPVPEQPPPLHPSNLESVPVLAVRVTFWPGGKSATQFVSPVTGEEQLIPPGLLVTVPPPVPVIVTINSGFLLRVAATCLSESIVKLHDELPEQAPLQAIWKADAGDPSSVTFVPAGNFPEQFPDEQSIPAGVLTISPLAVASLRLK
jgi:hypothetical protein